MKKKITKKKLLSASLLVIITVVLVGIGIFVYVKSHKKPVPTNEIPTVATQTTDSQQTTSETSTTQPNTPATSTPQATIPVPKQPTFTKSSGNNGPIPSGITVDFTCFSETNTTCSIILLLNGKQTVLGPNPIKDNGRGQYFTDFYWQSIKGKYIVTAQAKNTQGGVSSSANQTLEVQ